MKYKADPRIQKFTNKQVPFQFHGEKLRFDLSMGLFSSYDVDAGSRLLLKTIAKELDLSGTKTVLDTGCGTGVLGLSLKKKHSHLEMTFQDRDALAVAFTAHNAALNAIEIHPESLLKGLLLDDIERESQDLILCNIPAKAGDHVIKDFILKTSSCLKSGGIAAVVIVDTLKDLVKEAIEDSGSKILFSEATRMHTVYHFDKSTQSHELNFQRYIRRSGEFKVCEEIINLSTVYNLPDFDQLSYWLHVSAELLCHNSFSGKALFWNPGQGHIPVWLQSRPSNNFKSIHLASNDALQVKITDWNIKKCYKNMDTFCKIIASEDELNDLYDPESFDNVFFNLNPIPRVKWHQDLADLAHKLVKPGKYCFIMGRSADLSQLVKYIHGFKTIQDDRFKGNRGLLLKKN